MTYRIEQFVRKIKAPIVCRMDNEELSFSDGEELAAYIFDKYYIIDSVEGCIDSYGKDSSGNQFCWRRDSSY